MKRIHGVIEGQPSSCTYANVSFSSSPSSLSLHGDTTSPIYSSLSNTIYSDSNSTTVTATLPPFETCNSIDNPPFHPYYSHSQNITSYPYVPCMVYGCHLPAYKAYSSQEFQPNPYFFYPEETVQGLPMKQSSVSLPKNTVLSNILQKGPEMKIPDIPSKKSGKVLTSIENLKAIEEKEMKKEEEFRKKQERRDQGIFGFPYLLIVHCCSFF